MTSFDRREEAFEAKFAHDEERAFKARARALRMLGLWAAGKRGETGAAAEEYARALIEADIVDAGCRFRQTRHRSRGPWHRRQTNPRKARRAVCDRAEGPGVRLFVPGRFPEAGR